MPTRTQTFLLSWQRDAALLSDCPFSFLWRSGVCDLTYKQLLVEIGRHTIFSLLVFAANEMSVEKLRKMSRYLLVGHSFADFRKPIGYFHVTLQHVTLRYFHVPCNICIHNNVLQGQTWLILEKKATGASLYTPMHVLRAASIFLSSLHAWWRPTLRYERVPDPTFTHLPLISGFFFSTICNASLEVTPADEGKAFGWLKLAPNAKMYLNGSMRKGT